MCALNIQEYVPGEDEPYMNENQLLFFRKRLKNWREELISSSKVFLESLKEMSLRKPDDVEASATQADMVLDFQARQRQRHLIEQIDYALSRIEDGEYGYCEMTGEEIGLKRLMARPVATLCVEVQERHERVSGLATRYAMPC